MVGLEGLEGEVFVFGYYHTDSPGREVLVPAQVVDGQLEIPEKFGSVMPHEITYNESEGRCVCWLVDRDVSKVFTCRGKSAMYDELGGMVIHFSGGIGRYAFHYDSIAGLSDLRGIEIILLELEDDMDPDERERKRLELMVGLC